LPKKKKGCIQTPFIVPRTLRSKFKQVCEHEGNTATSAVVEFMISLDGFGVSPEYPRRHDPDDVRMGLNIPEEIHHEFLSRCRKGKSSMTREVMAFMERKVWEAETLYPEIFG